MSTRHAIVCSLGLCLALPLVAPAQTTYRWADQDGHVHYADQPPPPKTFKAEEKKLGPANIIASEPPYSSQTVAQNAPVVLYSSSNCVAECQIARDFFKQVSVPFKEIRIQTSADAEAFKKATGSQELLVPTLLVGTQTLKGFQDDAWRKLLSAAGYAIADTAIKAN